MSTLIDVPVRPAADAPPPAPRGPFWHLGSWCARYAWIVIAAWIVVLVGANVAGSSLNGSYNAQITLSRAPAQVGADLLQKHTPGASAASSNAQSGSVVFHVAGGSLTGDRAAIERATASLRHLAGVASVSDPFASVAPNGRAAVADIAYRDSAATLDASSVHAVDSAVAGVRSAGVSVDYGGDLGKAAGPSSSNTSSEIVGIGVALFLLLLAFGSVIATFLPVVSAVIGVFAGLGSLGILSAFFSFPSESPTIALMMGLGVGIDYALFLTTRFRQLIIDGVAPNDAVGRTIASSGRAVVIAAATVVISLIGLYASGVAYIGQLGVAAAITVAVAALSGITLVPALLGIAGRRIDVARIRRRPIAEPVEEKGAWVRYGTALGRHPVVYLTAALALLVVLALPVLSLHVGNPGTQALPTQTTERRAFDAVAADFGAGYQNPLEVVVSMPAGSSSAQLASTAATLHDRLAATPGVASATAFGPTKDHALLVGTVVPTTDSLSAKTVDLTHRLDRSVLPAALSGTGATGYVTGGFATELALSEAVSSTLPLVIGTVVAAAVLLLLLTFRSPLLAVKAGAINLLSIGASYGVLVAVFQWGWGSQLLGIAQPVPIVSFVPMLMFAIVFGLSMDYEVFLLARIRESFLGGQTNRGSITHGLAVTGRIITCAAIIMACVFLSFLLLPSPTIKMLALGLGVSVLLDATVVRLVLVPCAMLLFGRANWWTPRWLDRVLPHLEP